MREGCRKKEVKEKLGEREREREREKKNKFGIGNECILFRRHRGLCGEGGPKNSRNFVKMGVLSRALRPSGVEPHKSHVQRTTISCRQQLLFF